MHFHPHAIPFQIVISPLINTCIPSPRNHSFHMQSENPLHNTCILADSTCHCHSTSFHLAFSDYSFIIAPHIHCTCFHIQHTCNSRFHMHTQTLAHATQLSCPPHFTYKYSFIHSHSSTIHFTTEIGPLGPCPSQNPSIPFIHFIHCRNVDHKPPFVP